MSNLGLEVALCNMGGKLVRTAVGDRYVVEEMLRAGIHSAVNNQARGFSRCKHHG